MKKILLFDEELPVDGATEYGPMGLYAMAFNEVGIEVELAQTIEEVQQLLSDEGNEFDFVSLDVLVPDAGEVFSREHTENGRLSGVAVFQWIIENIDPLPPIVFLTNVPIALLKQRLEARKLERHQHWVKQKSETPPFEFVDFVKEKYSEITR